MSAFNGSFYASHRRNQLFGSVPLSGVTHGEPNCCALQSGDDAEPGYVGPCCIDDVRDHRPAVNVQGRILRETNFFIGKRPRPTAA